MIISGSELGAFIHGALDLDVQKDGFVGFNRLTRSQIDRIAEFDIVWPCLVNAGVSLRFVTDAESFSLDVRPPQVAEATPDTIDVFCNNALIKSYFDELTVKDRVSTLTVKLPRGKNSVCVYMPSDGIVQINNLEVAGKIEQSPRGEKVLYIGDSITQGYGTFFSGGTYVNTLNRLTGWDALNQGVGGYFFDKPFVEPLDFKPQKIIVSLGTNWHASSQKRAEIEPFFAALNGVYAGVPKIAVTPVWRCDEGTNMPELQKTIDEITRCCKKFGVTVADGFKLVPNRSEFYADGLHPSASGAMLYAVRLKEFVDKVWYSK